MLVAPLVLCSLVCGSMAIGDTKTLGKVGVKTICFYIATTALAASDAIPTPLDEPIPASPTASAAPKIAKNIPKFISISPVTPKSQSILDPF